MKATIQSSISVRKHGFALIATISVMVLLVMIALAMLSLSTVELRSSRSGLIQQEAQANARMAMMLALGELQKQVGPDQRVTSTAAILDDDVTTTDTEGVNHIHYLGVWNSWDTWLTDKKGGLSIGDTYQKGRHPSLFRKWLISHGDQAWQENMDSAISGNLPSEVALVVGKGSLGLNATTEDEVRVPLVKASGNGSYAYWVGDESEKAAIDLYVDADDLQGDFQLNQLRSSQIQRYGIGQLKNLSDFSVSKSEASKLITLGTGENTGADSDGIRARFHSLTSGTQMLLTDVRSSGLKRDLSLLFEADDLPQEMKRKTLFNGVEFDAPIHPMTGELAKVSPKNPFVAPTSWRQMRSYYRLYRKFDDFDKTARALLWSGGKPFTRRYLAGVKNHPHIMTTPDSDGYVRQPVLLRQTWILATRTSKGPITNKQQTYYCYLVAVPVFYLWNPYNVEMKMGSREMAFVASLDLAANLRYSLYKKGLKIADRDFNIGAENSTSYSSYMARPVATGLGEISFRPGEVIAFTLDRAGGAKEFDANYGYRPLADTAATRGLQLRLGLLDSVTSADRPSMALRFHSHPQKDDNFWWGSSSSALTVSMYQHNLGQYGAFDESGQRIIGFGGQQATVLGTRSIDWMTASEDGTWVVEDNDLERVEWDFSSSTPQPFAIVSMTAKDTEAFDYDKGGSGYAADFRNRTWLHSPPTDMNQYLINPNDLNRADAAYQVFFKPVNGDAGVSQYIQVNGRNAFYGGGFTAGTGQSMVPVYELPTTPPISLADFASMRLKHARAHTMQIQHSGTPSPPRYPMYNLKHVSRVGGTFGIGIGNGYAHPMIDGDQVYTQNSTGFDRGHPLQNQGAGTGIAFMDDYWDHLFLSNEELWDSYFLSSLVTDSSRGSGSNNLSHVLDNFFSKGSEHQPLKNRLLTPLKPSGSSDPTAELDTNEGWKKSAAYMMSRAPFNVNSTSVDAWKALLWGLKDRKISVLSNSDGHISKATAGTDEILISRFRVANSKGEGASASDADAWQGVRRLKASEIDRLAEEIVKQVKLRGPFLNMAEFVNRRLSKDKLGVTGALQAAIDWDEFDAGYSGTGSSSPESINRNYKTSADMISTLPAAYPNAMAARGSRYAGIPGYVMQSDLMQALGNTVTVRGDTFKIRAYGEAKDSNGRVLARAWCEAIVQRYPDYVDPSDDAWEPAKLAGGQKNTNLSETNHAFGRKFRITSFRWLATDEV